LDKLAPGGRFQQDYELVMTDVVDSFKLFFTKDGIQKEFREQMQTWRKFAAKLQKDCKAYEKAQQKRSAVRSKLNRVPEAVDNVPPLVATMRKA
jgi:hypothetical protein